MSDILEQVLNISDTMLDEKHKVLFQEVWSNNDLTGVVISYLEFIMLLKLRETSTLMLLAVSKEGQNLVKGIFGFQYKKQFTMTREMFKFINDKRVELISKEVSYDIENYCFPAWVTHGFSGFNNGKFSCWRGSLQWKLTQKISEAGLIEVSRSSTMINYTFDESCISFKIRLHDCLMRRFCLQRYFY
jgi:hypothetical protein